MTIDYEILKEQRFLLIFSRFLRTSKVDPSSLGILFTLIMHYYTFVRHNEKVEVYLLIIFNFKLITPELWSSRTDL
jgi:hypothetical protein